MDAQDRRALERFRFWDGQALRSRDLRDQLETEAQLRAWHDRAVHDSYGVPLGYDVTPQPATGSGPLTAVQVAAGLAYDCAGRLLLLQRAATLALPAAPGASGAVLLVASWRRDASFPERRLVEGACLPCGGSPLAEAPALGWLPEAGFDPVGGVALARLVPADGAWQLDPSFAALTVRPLTRPHLYCADTLLSGSPWMPWRWPDPVGGQAIGMALTVDTSAAGFNRTPHYFAWLRGWDPLAAGATSALVLTHVAQPASTSFSFRVVFAGSPNTVAWRLPPMGAARVLWLGCEEASPPDAGLTVERASCCC